MSSPATPIPLLDLAAQYRELRSEIDAAIARVVESCGFIGGKEVAGFEREFAAHLDARHVIGVANGTDALEVALQACGVGPGDTVLTVPFTFAATVEAIIRVGATPLFADIRDDDCTIDLDSAAEIFRRHPVKAVIPVHLYGHPADMDRLLPLARAHGACVVEDAAQAHGATCMVDGRRRRIGALGDAGCFSFYPTKNLGAMGDAGAVVCNRDDIAARVRLLANHGDAGKYRHVLPNGRNSRLDAIQAAVLRIKLRRLDAWNDQRRAVARRYAELLAALPIRLPTERAGVESVYHQYAVRVADRDRVRTALTARGIGTAIHYPLALHQQDGFRHLGFGPGAFPVAERCAAEVLSLPVSPHLDPAALALVAAALAETCG